MKLKICIIIICLIIFGCKSKVSYDGILIHRNDLPFIGYAENYLPERDIFLKTSISDSKFPDGVRYYLIIPKDGQYQNLKNNLGKMVNIEGEEYNSVTSSYISIDEELINPSEKEICKSLTTYYLEKIKIVKVY